MRDSLKGPRFIFWVWRTAATMNLNVSMSDSAGCSCYIWALTLRIYENTTASLYGLVKGLILKPSRKLCDLGMFELRETSFWVRECGAYLSAKPLISLMTRLNTSFFRKNFLRPGRNLPLILANPRREMFIKLAICLARLRERRDNATSILRPVNYTHV